MQSTLNQQLSTLDRAQKNYEKAFREAERAEDAYRKADADLNLSRADVEKQRINSSIKSHQCDDNKNEYAKQLQKTNELQTCHYQVRGKKADDIFFLYFFDVGVSFKTPTKIFFGELALASYYRQRGCEATL